jgi:hypothetical protein
MLNRRQALKQAVGASALAVGGGITIVGKTEAKTTVIKPTFEKVFHEIEFDKGTKPEFPMDLINNHYYNDILKPRVVLLDNNQYGVTVRLVNYDSDYITIPTYIHNSNNQQYYYGQVLFGSGVDRNMVVYDSRAENALSKRLIALMKTTMQNNHYKAYYQMETRYVLTDIFVEKTVVYVPHYPGVKIHLVDSETWNKVINCVESKLAPNKKNWVIGVDSSGCDSLIKAVVDDHHGIAVLDNRAVILGAY